MEDRNTKQNLVYEGKGKKIFSTLNSNHIIQEFKDDLTAFNAKKKSTFNNKGHYNNKISSLIFSFLEDNHIRTHYIKNLSERDMLCKKLDMIPLEVVVRNITAGSIASRFEIEEGMKLPFPIIEFFLKNDKLGDPLINEDHIVAFSYATRQEIKIIKERSLTINQLIGEYFALRSIILVDFKLEYGKNPSSEILLGDEISPDSCRLWDAKTNKKLDKDVFRFDLGSVEDAYKEILKRI